MAQAKIDAGSYGLSREVLSPMETLAQSVSTIAPTTTPVASIPLVCALVGNGTWLVYFLATAAILLVALCLAASKHHGFFSATKVQKYEIKACMVASSYLEKPGICACGFFDFGLRTYAAKYSGDALAQVARTSHGRPAFWPPSAPRLWQRKQFCCAMW
jgi:hypothetical protein